MQWFNKIIASMLPYFPKQFVWIFSKRYIAGKSLDEGIVTAKALNDLGCCATMDVLGEDIFTLDEATQAKNESLRVLDTISGSEVDSSLSIKLTSLGLRIDKDRCFENTREIVEKAESLGNFVRIDMEDSTTTDDTLEIYRRLRKDHDNVGAAIQAYMHRSKDDVRRLIDDGIAHLRVCKGIYNESKTIAFKDKDKIRDNFMDLIRMLFESGSYVGVATHDKILADKSLNLIRSMKIEKFKYEFQMLLGVTEKMRTDIVADGHKLRVYVPYGDQWFGYCTRRLKENPQMAGHIIKNIFIRG